MMFDATAAGPAAFGDVDYQGFQQKVQGRCGIRLGDYKAEQMRRRVMTMAQQAECASFGQYFATMERDPATLAGFLQHMTINVTELLRNPERFAELSRTVLPDLIGHRRGGPLSAWSAGCSYGAEAYTLAMLLEETAPGPPHRILGTDIDPTVLAQANSPRFSAADMAQVSAERRRVHFTSGPDSTCFPSDSLRSYVRFSRHDLLTSSYPTSEYDLILCRNVLIYFTDEAKDRLYRGFFRALRPGGVLFVGGTERLTDHRALGLELIQPFFYRKPA